MHTQKQQAASGVRCLIARRFRVHNPTASRGLPVWNFRGFYPGTAASSNHPKTSRFLDGPVCSKERVWLVGVLSNCLSPNVGWDLLQLQLRPLVVYLMPNSDYMTFKDVGIAVQITPRAVLRSLWVHTTRRIGNRGSHTQTQTQDLFTWTLIRYIAC